METDYGPVCRQHLEFVQWADDVMLAALADVPQDKLTHDLGNSFRSLFDTLNHVYLAELVWLRRVTGEPNALIGNQPAPTDLQGTESRVPYWQIVPHPVNHGSYHRGQVATMLRQSGIKPPGADLILFYKSRQ